MTKRGHYNSSVLQLEANKVAEEIKGFLDSSPKFTVTGMMGQRDGVLHKCGDAVKAFESVYSHSDSVYEQMKGLAVHAARVCEKIEDVLNKQVSATSLVSMSAFVGGKSLSMLQQYIDDSATTGQAAKGELVKRVRLNTDNNEIRFVDQAQPVDSVSANSVLSKP